MSVLAPLRSVCLSVSASDSFYWKIMALNQMLLTYLLTYFYKSWRETRAVGNCKKTDLKHLAGASPQTPLG